MADDELELRLEGRLAGRLHRAPDGRVELEYDPGYRLAPNATRLSVSMPLDRAGHGPAAVMPWLSNLLPDNERVRIRWAEHFGSTDTTAFGLLRYMGQDCAGAVQVLPPGSDPEAPARLIPLSDADIAARIAELRSDNAAWNPDDEEAFGRWSLGGVQGKFALARVGGSWMLPSGRAASTHIVKVGVRSIPDSDLAEYATNRAARSLGLPVASSAIMRFGDETAYVTTRYDRLANPDGTVRRLHQEDFCQALGIWPDARYEKAETGPTLGDMAAVVNESTAPGDDREQSRFLLARAVTFTLLAIGTDAHAKNHSLLHVGSRSRMAPLYDLGSAAFVFDGEPLLERAKLPVRFGTSFWLREVDGAQMLRVADTLGLGRDEYADIVRDMAGRIADAFSDAVRGLPVATGNPHFAAAPGVIATLAERITRSLDRVSPSAVELFAAPRRHAPGRSGEEWIPGRRRGGEWVFGRPARAR